MTRKKGGEPKSRRRTPAAAVEGVDWASDASETRISWLLQGALPSGGMVMLEGRKGTGKSVLTCALAAASTAGVTFPRWTGSPHGRVIWAGSEDPWESVVVPRLRAAMANLALVGRLSKISVSGTQRRLVLPDDLAYLRDILLSARPQLLVLDPYVSLAAPGIDMRVEQQARCYLEPLAELLAEVGVSGVLIRHLRKGTGGDARDAGLGAGAVGNVSRGILRCDEHPLQRGDYVLSVVAGNWAVRMPTQVYRLINGLHDYPRIEWLGDSTLQADEIAEGRGTATQRDEATDADRLLMDLLATGSMRYDALWKEAQAAGITAPALRASKVRLKVRSNRLRFGGGGHWEWSAPAAGFPPSDTKSEQGGGGRARGRASMEKSPKPKPQKPRKSSKGAIDARKRTRTPPRTPKQEENGHDPR